MPVPNLKHIVQAVRDSKPWDFSTKEGLCAYTHAVVSALHDKDSDFMHLKKRKPKNGCYAAGSDIGHAIDAALYVPTGQAVDFIGSAGVGGANPVSWTLHGENEYTAADALDPDDLPDPVPVPPIPPEEPMPDLEPRVVALESQLAGLVAQAAEILKQLGSINEGFAKLDAEVVKKPLPEYFVKIFGFNVNVNKKPVE